VRVGSARRPAGSPAPGPARRRRPLSSNRPTRPAPSGTRRPSARSCRRSARSRSAGSAATPAARTRPAPRVRLVGGPRRAVDQLAGVVVQRNVVAANVARRLRNCTMPARRPARRSSRPWTAPARRQCWPPRLPRARCVACPGPPARPAAPRAGNQGREDQVKLKSHTHRWLDLMASEPKPALLLHRTMRTQEIHEAGFPTAAMPRRSSPAHTALGTGTRAVRIAGPALRLVRTEDLTMRSLTMKWETPAAAEIRLASKSRCTCQSLTPNSWTTGGGVH